MSTFDSAIMYFNGQTQEMIAMSTFDRGGSL